VVIIVDEAPNRPQDRVLDFLDPTLTLDVEPRVYTVGELLHMAREGRRLVEEVVEHGKLLAGDGGLIEAARALLRRHG